jgi:hypothetical protein
MKNYHSIVDAFNGRPALPRCPGRDLRSRFRRGALLAFFLGALCLLASLSASAQAAPAADKGGLRLSAGVTFSAYELGYGQVKIFGESAFVDADTLRHFGVEGEGRLLNFHLKSYAGGPGGSERANTYLIGPRYSRYYGRFQPYAKALVGFGQFTYPYGLARETDLVVAGGGGLDYRLTNRIRWRAADVEYQFWPQFTFGRMSSYGVSSGIRFKIF